MSGVVPVSLFESAEAGISVIDVLIKGAISTQSAVLDGSSQTPRGKRLWKERNRLV